MNEVSGEPIPRRCPRCGGLMVKAPGSSFYWHAEPNHSRCDITNIADPPLAVRAIEEPPFSVSPKGKRPKK